MAFLAETLLEALLDLLQGVVEISSDEDICTAADDREHEAVTTLAGEGDAFVWEIKVFAKLAIGILQLNHEATDIVADFLRVRVT